MIKVIGTKRLILLFLLIGANAFFAVALYLYFLPDAEAKERKERTLRSALVAVQSDIEGIRLEFEQLDQQQEEFDLLKKRGFFFEQTRSEAKKIFSNLQERSRVVSAVVSVRPGVVEDDEEAQKASYKILNSEVGIEIGAFDDGDIYRYLDMLEKGFPGHLTLESIEIERVMDVNAAVLRAIGSGANPVMLKADVKMSWRTMIPESQVITAGDGL